MSEDLENKIMAHRYLYYVLGKPIITDREYDELEKRASILPPNSPVHKPGSDLASSYTYEQVNYFNE